MCVCARARVYKHRSHSKYISQHIIPNCMCYSSFNCFFSFFFCFFLSFLVLTEISTPAKTPDKFLVQSIQIGTPWYFIHTFQWVILTGLVASTVNTIWYSMG